MHFFNFSRDELHLHRSTVLGKHRQDSIRYRPGESRQRLLVVLVQKNGLKGILWKPLACTTRP